MPNTSPQKPHIASVIATHPIANGASVVLYILKYPYVIAGTHAIKPITASNQYAIPNTKHSEIMSSSPALTDTIRQHAYTESYALLLMVEGV